MFQIAARRAAHRLTGEQRGSVSCCEGAASCCNQNRALAGGRAKFARLPIYLAARRIKAQTFHFARAPPTIMAPMIIVLAIAIIIIAIARNNSNNNNYRQRLLKHFRAARVSFAVIIIVIIINVAPGAGGPSPVRGGAAPRRQYFMRAPNSLVGAVGVACQLLPVVDQVRQPIA